MSFGDSGPADAYTPGGIADPEQLARRLHDERLHVGLERERWEQLPATRRAMAVLVMVRLLIWIRREGSV